MALLSPIRATCPAHFILLDFITRTILGKGYISFSSSICSFLHSPVTSSLLGPKYSHQHPILKHPQRLTTHSHPYPTLLQSLRRGVQYSICSNYLHFSVFVRFLNPLAARHTGGAESVSTDRKDDMARTAACEVTTRIACCIVGKELKKLDITLWQKLRCKSTR